MQNTARFIVLQKLAEQTPLQPGITVPSERPRVISYGPFRKTFWTRHYFRWKIWRKARCVRSQENLTCRWPKRKIAKESVSSEACPSKNFSGTSLGAIIQPSSTRSGRGFRAQAARGMWSAKMLRKRKSLFQKHGYPLSEASIFVMRIGSTIQHALWKRSTDTEVRAYKDASRKINSSLRKCFPKSLLPA